MESGSFCLPAVNIGIRQQGRERGRNVIDCAAKREEIRQAVRRALSDDFRKSLHGMVNPYGDGHSSERIARILLSVSLSESLIVKAPVTIHLQRSA